MIKKRIRLAFLIHQEQVPGQNGLEGGRTLATALRPEMPSPLFLTISRDSPSAVGHTEVRGSMTDSARIFHNRLVVLGRPSALSHMSD